MLKFGSVQGLRLLLTSVLWSLRCGRFYVDICWMIHSFPVDDFKDMLAFEIIFYRRDYLKYAVCCTDLWWNLGNDLTDLKLQCKVRCCFCKKKSLPSLKYRKKFNKSELFADIMSVFILFVHGGLFHFIVKYGHSWNCVTELS